MFNQNVHAEHVRLLAELIRFDTTTAQAQEGEAIAFLADWLRQRGLEAQVVEPRPGKANLVVRLRGRGQGGPLLLFAHVDTVPPEGEWRYPPFGGVVADGFVWGRGAVDDKCQVATWLMIAALVQRRRVPLARDLVVAITCDEEDEGRWGMGYLAERCPELIACEAAITEGGGYETVVAGTRYFSLEFATKGALWLRACAHGPGGHSMVPGPGNPNFPVASLVAALERRAVFPPRGDWLENVARQIGPERMRLLRANPYLGLSGNTVVPTQIHGGSAPNVVPASVCVDLDCRLLPGEDPETVLRPLRDLAGEQVSIEELSWSPPSASPPDHPLAEHISRVAGPRLGAPIVPEPIAGTTDARFLRRLGVPTYGFYPLTADTPTGLEHRPDERIALRSLWVALEVMYEVVVSWCGEV